MMWSLLLLPVALGVLSVVNLPNATAPAAAAATLGMRASVPAYFYPGSAPDPTWTRLESGAPTVDLAVLNPASGPGTSSDPSYTRQVAEAQSSGLAIIGYVDTSYAARPLAEVKAEIDRYYSWYGVDGIFFDQSSSQAADQPYFVNLFNDVKARTGKRTVVLNPGTTPDESYMAAADIVLTFEGTFTSYKSRLAPAWEANYPAERFWHLIYQTNKTEMRRAVDLARSRNVGHLYVTADDLPNPWDTLPADRYWSDELARIAG